MQRTAGPTVLYLHGGAYVRPADARHWRFVTRLADALDARAVLPVYPLAPEFTVEDSFDEMVELFEEVASRSPRAWSSSATPPEVAMPWRSPRHYGTGVGLSRNGSC